jgi:hypothetical protein
MCTRGFSATEQEKLKKLRSEEPAARIVKEYESGSRKWDERHL